MKTNLSVGVALDHRDILFADLRDYGLTLHMQRVKTMKGKQAKQGWVARRTYDLAKVGHATVMHEAVATEYERVIIGGHDRRSARRADMREDSLRGGIATNKSECRVSEAVIEIKDIKTVRWSKIRTKSTKKMYR